MDQPWLRMPADWVTARRVGAARQELKDRTTGTFHARPGAYQRGPNNRQNADNRNLENIVGYVGELAFAKYFGLPLPTFKEHRVADDGFDFETPLGRLDVKSCKTKPWFMPVVETGLQKPLGPELYALMYCPIDDPHTWLTGWTLRADVLVLPIEPNCYEPKNLTPRLDIPGRVVPLPLREPCVLAAKILFSS